MLPYHGAFYTPSVLNNLEQLLTMCYTLSELFPHSLHKGELLLLLLSLLSSSLLFYCLIIFSDVITIIISVVKLYHIVLDM